MKVMVGNRHHVTEASLVRAMSLALANDSENRSYVYTSHGMELAPGFYLGGGVGAAYWWEMEEWNVPVFVDARLEFHKSLRKNFLTLCCDKGRI